MATTRETELLPCPCCEQASDTIQRRRLNTAYHHEESNFLTSCQECYDEAHQYYADLWSEYYAGCM